MKQDTIRKTGIDNIININGKINHPKAVLVITWPDSIKQQTQNLEVTSHGVIDAFVYLDSFRPAGLYTVEVKSLTEYDQVKKTFTDYFFVTDYEGLLDVYIQRNVVIGCESTGVKISEECMQPSRTKIPLSYGMRFFNEDFKNHQMSVGGVTTGVILPDGDGIVHPTRTGTITYNCLIHPWVGGQVTVVKVPGLSFNPKDVRGHDDPRGVKSGEINNLGGTIPPPDQEEVKKKIKDGEVIDINDININDIKDNRVNIVYDYSFVNCTDCHIGTVTGFGGGHSIYVDNVKYEMAGINPPRRSDSEHNKARDLLEMICPTNMMVLVDIDNVRPKNLGTNLAKIQCGEVIANQRLVEVGLGYIYKNKSCDSEFTKEPWLINHCPEVKKALEDEVNKLKTCEVGYELQGDKCIIIPPDKAVDVINNTITNNTTVKKIANTISDEPGDVILLFILGVAVVCIVVLVIIVMKMKGNSSHVLKDEMVFNIKE